MFGPKREREKDGRQKARKSAGGRGADRVKSRQTETGRQKDRWTERHVRKDTEAYGEISYL